MTVKMRGGSRWRESLQTKARPLRSDMHLVGRSKILYAWRTSRSTIPTRWPWAASEKAMFTAVVDLPTPPLQLATATMCATFATPGGSAVSVPSVDEDADAWRSFRPSELASCCSGDMSEDAGAAGCRTISSSKSLIQSSPSRSSFSQLERTRSPAPADAASVGISMRTLTESSVITTARTRPRETTSEPPSGSVWSSRAGSSTSDRTSITSDWRSSVCVLTAPLKHTGDEQTRRDVGDNDRALQG
eukprot:5087910-Pleurochrysis_carterae.AAC.4